MIVEFHCSIKFKLNAPLPRINNRTFKFKNSGIIHKTVTQLFYIETIRAMKEIIVINSLFQKPGKFFRGNLHTHSNFSDGKLDPEEICRRYENEGYDFISITDHHVGEYNHPVTDTRKFQNSSFTTIPGAELHSGKMKNGGIWHILAVGLPFDFTPAKAPGFVHVDGQETGPELARRARDAGAFVAIAHPQWSAMHLEDARSIDVAHAIEIYNHGCFVCCDRGDGAQTADLLFSEGRRLNLIATDDSHFHENDQFGGWVMVKAEKNDPKLLLEALKRGDFYSSQGPKIHEISFEDNAVEVKSSPVSAVIAQGCGSATSAIHGESMNAARVSLSNLSASPWVRITVRDIHGKRAWSNCIWKRHSRS